MSGALVCQGQKYADIQMGTGAIVIGLAAIVIGEVLFGWFRNFALKLSAAVIGSVIYFVIRAFVIKMGMNPNYMKLLSAKMCIRDSPFPQQAVSFIQLTYIMLYLRLKFKWIVSKDGIYRLRSRSSIMA